MDDKSKDLVKLWILDKPQSILYFDADYQSRLRDAVSLDGGKFTKLGGVIMYVLYCAKGSNSYTIDENGVRQCETTMNKNRSVLDIWRHVRSIYPDTTIFEVMAVLRNLVMIEKISTLVCANIGRRVFYFSILNNYYSDSGKGDEFGLQFESWE